MSWNDERVEMLKKMWAEGMSASQIAGELANGITRNAVIGKVHRLGLSGRVKAPSPVQSRPRPQVRAHRNSTPRASQPIIRGNTALAFAPRVHEAPAPRPIEEVLIPMCEPVTIMELRETMCRWPVGDPATSEFRYCGGPSNIGESYCGYHSRIAYQPAQDRRRDRDRRALRLQ
jgi:GcrA cell cycle regulator